MDTWKAYVIGVALVAGLMLIFAIIYLFSGKDGKDGKDDDAVDVEGVFYRPGSLGYWPLDSPIYGPVIVEEMTDIWSDVAAVINAAVDFYKATNPGFRMIPVRYCRLGKLDCHIEFDRDPPAPGSTLKVDRMTHRFTFFDQSDVKNGVLIVEKSEYQDDPYFRPGTLNIISVD